MPTDESAEILGLDKKDLLDLLIADRDHHFHHPQAVNRQVLITIATSAATLLGATLVFDGKESIPGLVTLVVVLIVFGLFLIVWGLAAHAERHASQRIRLENLIDRVAYADDAEQARRFLAKDRRPHPDRGRLPLLAAEPDRRKCVKHHDTRIFVGVLLIALAILVYVIALAASDDSTVMMQHRQIGLGSF